MGPIGMSDELAMVRARLAALKAREAALCRALDEGDALMRLGRWTQAHPRERRLRLFDHRLLPLEVQADPAFWVERTQREMVCLLRDGSRVPPAMRRAAMGDGMAAAADANLIGGAALI